MQADEHDWFEEWLSTATIASRADDGLRHAVSRLILAPAGVYAAYGAGVLSYRLRRFVLLRHVIDAYIKSPNQWIYQTILGGGAGALEPWILRSLQASKVFHRAVSTVGVPSDKEVGIVSGLAILKALAGVPQTCLDDFVRADNVRVDVPVADFPGFYFPSACWVPTLASQVAASSKFEREIGHEIFDLAPDGLRSLAKRVTPALAKIVNRLNWEAGRRVEWGYNVDATPWNRWCGITSEGTA